MIGRSFPKKAREFAKRALELDPEDAEYHVLMGHVLAALGDLDAAEAEFEMALRLSPDSFIPHNDYGVFLLNHRKLPKAAFPFFREAIRFSPDDPDVRYNFMLSLKAKNRFYGLFWNWSLMLHNMGKYRGLFIVGVWIFIQILRQVGKLNPQLYPVIIPILIMYVLFCIYTWVADPLFNLLIRKGWIR